MKLYLSIKKMTFEEDDIEHNIINGVFDKEYFGYDEIIELPNNSRFVKDILRVVYKKNKDGKETKEIEHKQFIVREQKTWWNFPLYELKDGKIKKFNYKEYAYFEQNTDRRNTLAEKINNLYSGSSEFKILRKTIKYLLGELKIDYPDFTIMNNKIEDVINKNPKKLK
ncbi:unnamed protein product [marine sediment metagenome]|uniref:Uncharacterized protein n=1 Tax=marine sediment metagenome TaxID=412755 RepID=X1G9N2_9ZZZZ